MIKQAKYKRLAEITCKHANLLSENNGARLVRDTLLLYPKIANTRPFQKYMTDHVDFITSPKSERELIIDDVKERLSKGENLQDVAGYFAMSCEEINKLANASPPEAIKMLKDQIYAI